MFNPINSITNDINFKDIFKEHKSLEVLNEDLKLNFDTSKSKNTMCQPKLDNNSVLNVQKKSVTFCLPADDYNMKNQNCNDFLNRFKNVNAKLMEPNMHSNQISLNYKPKMNIESMHMC